MFNLSTETKRDVGNPGFGAPFYIGLSTSPSHFTGGGVDDPVRILFAIGASKRYPMTTGQSKAPLQSAESRPCYTDWLAPASVIYTITGDPNILTPAFSAPFLMIGA